MTAYVLSVCVCDSDAPDSDIVGSNLYQSYVDRLKRRRRQILVSSPENRNCQSAVLFLRIRMLFTNTQSIKFAISYSQA